MSVAGAIADVGSRPLLNRFRPNRSVPRLTAKNAGSKLARAFGRIAMLRTVAGVVGLCAVAFTSAAAQDAAKDYPNRAIHIVVPFPAGGPADVAARLLAQRMNE